MPIVSSAPAKSLHLVVEGESLSEVLRDASVAVEEVDVVWHVVVEREDDLWFAHLYLPWPPKEL